MDDAAPRHFTLRTPEGHMFAGWVRFKAAPAPSGTVATAEMIVRPSDPLYQVGLWFGGNRAEDRFWMHTLQRLAMRFAAPPSVMTERRLLSRSFNWRAAGNVRHNAAMQTLLGQLGSVARAAARKIVGRA